MIREIVCASKNEGKIRELKALLKDLPVRVTSLADYEDIPEVVEDGETFLENAVKKAKAVATATGKAVIADDSGLEVEFLAGRPGVRSSRYAGPGATDEANMEKLLEELVGVSPERREAAFRCVLVFCTPEGTCEHFEGIWTGLIALSPRGAEGFGYDPVFIVPEYGKTVAELHGEVKNRISHRAKAFAKLRKRIEEYLA